ncbi:hypothetical protein LINPERHAP1_LOCUS34850 [Linum perenne]
MMTQMHAIGLLNYMGRCNLKSYLHREKIPSFFSFLKLHICWI